MKYLRRLILGPLGVAAVLPVYADTLTVSASTDAWILAENRNANFDRDFRGLRAGIGPVSSATKFYRVKTP